MILRLDQNDIFTHFYERCSNCSGKTALILALKQLWYREPNSQFEHRLLLQLFVQYSFWHRSLQTENALLVQLVDVRNQDDLIDIMPNNAEYLLVLVCHASKIGHKGCYVFKEYKFKKENVICARTPVVTSLRKLVLLHHTNKRRPAIYESSRRQHDLYYRNILLKCCRKQRNGIIFLQAFLFILFTFITRWQGVRFE